MSNKTKTDPSEKQSPQSAEDPSEHALAALMPRILAMEPGEVLRETRLDATTAGAIAGSASKKVESLREALVAQFGAESGKRLDELPSLARAVQQAAVDEAVTAAPTNLSSLYDAVRAEYDLLFGDLASLVRRKLVPAIELDKARAVQGYDETVSSTLILVGLFEAFWPQVKDQTPVKQADLARAKAAAQRLRDTLSDRALDVHRMPAVEVRIRAVTLLINLYAQLRREVSYLRYFQEDVDTFMPSLWSGRGRRARNELPEAPVVDDDVVTPSGPVTPGTPVAPGGNPLVNG